MTDGSAGLKSGWLGEELRDARLAGAREEVASAEAGLVKAKRDAEALVDEARERLRKALNEMARAVQESAEAA